MRLENYSVAAFEALEPEEAPPETSWPAAIQAGKDVRVQVGPVYAGLAQVPSRMKWCVGSVSSVTSYPSATDASQHAESP